MHIKHTNAFYVQNAEFLDALVKSRKATISFNTSICLSVHMERLSSHWTDFHDIFYLNTFRKPVDKIQVLLKSDKNNGYLHDDVCTFISIFRWILLTISDEKLWRTQKNTYFMSSNYFPWKSCSLWTMWKTQTGNIIRRMRTSCWITKYCFSTAEQLAFFRVWEDLGSNVGLATG